MIGRQLRICKNIRSRSTDFFLLRLPNSAKQAGLKSMDLLWWTMPTMIMAQKGLHLIIEWVIESVSLNSKILFHSNQASPSWKTNYNTSLRTTRVSNTLSLIQARWVKAIYQHLRNGKKLTQLKAKKTWWTKFSHRDTRIQLSTQKLISQVLLWFLLIWDTKIKLIQPIT